MKNVRFAPKTDLAHPQSYGGTPLANAAVALLVALAGCGAEEVDSDPPPPPPPQIEAPVCLDAAAGRTELQLQSSIAPGAIVNTDEGTSILSEIDATAGGFLADPPDAYVYATVNETGLTKVSVSDVAALTSLDWHLAFRRCVIRINSGDSGPGAVKATRFPEGVTFDQVTTPPPGATYFEDDFYTDTCELIPDSYGLGYPATVTANYWRYTNGVPMGCLDMTGIVYVIELPTGRHIKMAVESYYYPNVQQECADTLTVSTMPTGSGNIRMRWAFLD